MFRRLNCGNAAVWALVLTAIVGNAVSSSLGLGTPSDEALASTVGGACIQPGASCLLSNACVLEGGP
jgi:hypothetical protein